MHKINAVNYVTMNNVKMVNENLDDLPHIVLYYEHCWTVNTDHIVLLCLCLWKSHVNSGIIVPLCQ